MLFSFENGNIWSCKIERFAWKHDGVDFQDDSPKLFHLKFSRCMNEFRMPKSRPSLGREPVQKVRNHEQSVKRTRLLWTKFRELIRLLRPSASICSHILPIIPMLYSRTIAPICSPSMSRCWMKAVADTALVWRWQAGTLRLFARNF